MIAIVTNQGKTRWSITDEPFKTDKLIEFLRNLWGTDSIFRITTTGGKLMQLPEFEATIIGFSFYLYQA